MHVSHGFRMTRLLRLLALHLQLSLGHGTSASADATYTALLTRR